jgi:predicted RNase H-like HicB family nuclease
MNALNSGEQMKRYLIVVEQTGTGYSAYSPDLPGCVSTGRSREDVERNMREAIAFHLVDCAKKDSLCPSRRRIRPTSSFQPEARTPQTQKSRVSWQRGISPSSRVEGKPREILSGRAGIFDRAKTALRMTQFGFVSR